MISFVLVSPKWEGESFDDTLSKYLLENNINTNIPVIVDAIYPRWQSVYSGSILISSSIWNISNKAIKNISFILEPIFDKDKSFPDWITDESLITVDLDKYIEPLITVELDEYIEPYTKIDFEVETTRCDGYITSFNLVKINIIYTDNMKQEFSSDQLIRKNEKIEQNIIIPFEYLDEIKMISSVGFPKTFDDDLLYGIISIKIIYRFQGDSEHIINITDQKIFEKIKQSVFLSNNFKTRRVSYYVDGSKIVF